MTKLFRQTWALTKKTLILYVLRYRITTWLRALVLPVAFIIWVVHGRSLFLPPDRYGIGVAAPIANLANAIDPQLKLALVSNNLGGDVARVINSIQSSVSGAGKMVEVLLTDADLSRECKQSLRGTSQCFAAAVFYSSPDNPQDGDPRWNYTLRGDATLGFTFDVTNHGNGVEGRIFPLQHAIDWTIASQAGEAESISTIPEEFMYTKLTQQEHDSQSRRNFQDTIIRVTAVIFLIPLIGIIFQLVGLVAVERESGISQLVQAMGGKGASLARLMSYSLAFDLIYLPGWVIMGIVLGDNFPNTSRVILLFSLILTGLSLSSMAVFGGSFFKKAQLSGSTVTIVTLALGAVAQIFNKRLGDAAIAILGLLFPPMSFVWFIVWMAHFEKANEAANLFRAAPGNPWSLPGIVFWVFFIVHIIVFVFLALLVEKWRYGVTERNRSQTTTSKDNAVEIRGFTKRYVPGFFDKQGGIFARKKKRKETVVAVNALDLDIRKGAVVALLGANGSGKTTTLESVVGLGTITEGTIAVDLNVGGSGGGLGICPQKNVLWDVLTVEEHIWIWNEIKCDGDDKNTLRQLLRDCDLEPKRKAQTKTLSGGQKRKLQLAIALTGGSTVCAIDEVSSGLDPLSRRKIWDIILAQRGRCTIMLTTHFLDEADLLSDHIAILSKGNLKVQGSSVELKAKLGGGYRVTVIGNSNAPSFPGISDKHTFDQTVYSVSTSESAGTLGDMLEKNGIFNYHVTGPTIEDVFLKVAEDSLIEAYGPNGLPVVDNKEGVRLYPGRRLGVLMQAWWMFRKRVIILRRNYLPTLAAIAIPLLTAGLTMFIMKKSNFQACSRAETLSIGQLDNFNLFSQDGGFKMVVGPSSRVSLQRLSNLTNLFPGIFNSSSDTTNVNNSILSQVSQSLTIVESYSDFYREIRTGYTSYTPGGFFLGNQSGDSPVFAFGGKDDFLTGDGIIVQNIMDNILFQNMPPITTGYAPFDFTWAPNTTDTLQFVIYFSLAMACFPAFFALYPTLERLRQVRALHYSNGVRSLPLWTAYVIFDFTIVLFISIACIIVFAAAAPHSWYHLPYLFPVIFLYGLASILFAYVISLVAKSQLAAFAFAAGIQAVMFLIYFVAFTNVLTYTKPSQLDKTIYIVHFVLAAISPMGNLARGLFVSVNFFQTDCRGEDLASYAGAITLYGGPILYLILQSMFLFCLLLWWDSGIDRVAGGFSIFGGSGKSKAADNEDQVSSVAGKVNEKELQDELIRVTSAGTTSGDTSSDGLRIIHLTKKFKSNVAVNNITFGVPHSSVFALLGPNGAGKTTTINMVRGDMLPTSGDILVENVSVIKHRARARAHLGVCPQFDAMDQMTVLEHLKLYARIRGISPEHVRHNVSTVISAVGLSPYVDRMAGELSGGNKRKLSLAIALMGDPTVLLLDEPSSGMDAASKRVMWTTLRSVVHGRSLVLTTHSMEEADALADRAGIVAGKMLALGSSNSLRRKYGDRYNVHLVLKSAPNTPEEEMARVKNWILNCGLEDVVLGERSFFGQVRFSVAVPTNTSLADRRLSIDNVAEVGAETGQRHGLSRLFRTMEDAKGELGIEYVYVSQVGLEDIFLKIVRESGYGEEGYGETGQDGSKWQKLKLIRWRPGASGTKS